MIIPKLFRWLFFKNIIEMTTKDAIKHPKASLVDVREAYELATDGVVENAINIPMSEIPDRLDELKALSKPIVIFCRGGSRAASVLNYLSENDLDGCFNGGGFNDVNEILHAK